MLITGQQSLRCLRIWILVCTGRNSKQQINASEKRVRGADKLAVLSLHLLCSSTVPFYCFDSLSDYCLLLLQCSFRSHLPVSHHTVLEDKVCNAL
jgi:flavin reductase (DIM6/NTAB) family NADH-FMN oxidoreductase RutF